jgi:hypothetical protein
MTDPQSDPGLSPGDAPPSDDPSPGAVPPGDLAPGAAPSSGLSPDLGAGDGSPDVTAAVPGTDGSGPVYYALEDWLSGYFLPMFRRTLGGEYRWCHQWWQHGEAISRLTALWHAWEVLRLQPGTGIATWYRDHLDHQLPILMGPRGPFYQCSETAHREPHQAETTPAPDDWWDLGDDSELLPVPVLGSGDDEPADLRADDGNS